MGLATMILGLAVFIGVHAITTLRGRRAEIVARVGEPLYKIGYSLASAVGIALIVYGFARYRAGGWVDVWMPPPWTRHIAVALMWPAVVCVIAAYARGHIQRWLKHPMLVGVKLWAAAHLIANGDLGSIILFGSFLGWAVYDRITLRHRTDPGGPPIPVGDWRNDVVAVVVGTIVYLALGFVFHPLIIGVPAFTP